MKNMRELKKEIGKLEKKLEEDKEGIQDNLKLVQLFTGILPDALKPDRKNGKTDWIDELLIKIAQKNITLVEKPKSSLELIKEIIFHI